MNEQDPLSLLLRQINFAATVFFREGYCGGWAVDTSGSTQVPFHLVCQGEGWLHSEDRPPRKLIAGQIVFFPHDSPHVLSAQETPPDPEMINHPPPPRLEGNVTRLVCGYFSFNKKVAAPLLSSLPTAVVLDLSQSDDASTRELVNLWMREAARDTLGSTLAVDRLAELVFIQMLRNEIDNGRLQGVIGALGDPQIGKVLADIHHHPGADHNLVGMAARAGLSESAFNVKFKKLVGLAPGQYVKHWRMQTAATALRETNRSMFDITESVGYESEAAFRKAFSAHFGTAPGAYRRQSS
ncbi:MAG: AraC family transcriptional regulator [Pseudomonadota bacterium]